MAGGKVWESLGFEIASKEVGLFWFSLEDL
jgi:hypothetical protein